MGLFNWKKKQEEPVVQENSPVSCHFSEIAQEIITKLSGQSTANGTIGEVADSLRQSPIWYFWWD